MHHTLTLIAALSLSAPVLAQESGGGVPKNALVSLLEAVPAEAEGIVFLNDLDAAHRQGAVAFPDLEGQDKLLAALGPLYLPPRSFSGTLILYLGDTPLPPVGVPISRFRQMAGWGEPPEALFVGTGVSEIHSTIAEALGTHGFAQRTLGDTIVWHILDDFEINQDALPINPFNDPPLGRALRIALKGDRLLISRSFDGMETLLSPPPSFADDPDRLAIASALYAFEDAGDPLVLLLIAGQPRRMLDPALFLGQAATPERVERLKAQIAAAEAPGLPQFAVYGLALWQSGRTMTGAVVIPYRDPADAEAARERFTDLLAVAESPSENIPFDKLLPGQRQFEIVQASERAVLVMAFEKTHEAGVRPNPTTLASHPLGRLYRMHATRDLNILIGAAP